MADWIEVTKSREGKVFAWIACPQCGGIVHIDEIFYPARVSPSPSGDELRITLWCEQGHRCSLEVEDHSGVMTMAAVPIRDMRVTPRPA